MGADERTNKTGSRKAAIEAAAERPPALPVNPDGIPAELKARPQWVCWRAVRKGGRWNKIPYQARNGKPAETDNPETWCDFDTAYRSYQTVGRREPDGLRYYSGIGYVFAADDPYCGVDLDDCRDSETGELAEWARPHLALLDSYAEVSPSGTGCKVYLRGKAPVGWRKWQHFENYDSGRFFAVTGVRLDQSPGELLDRQEALDQFHAEVSRLKQEADKTKRSPGGKATSNGAGLADWQLIRKAMAAKNGAKFAQLWAGDTGGHGGDDSAADLALCSLLCFWCKGDAGRIDGLFRKSGLMRAKWDEKHFADGRTYGQATVQKAIEGKTEFYGSRRNGKPAPGGGCPPNAGNDGHDGGGNAGPDGLAIILEHFRQYFQPIFRRGNVLYSGALGREVKPSEATSAPGRELLVKLQDAVDTPRDKHGISSERLPWFFRQYAGSAWKDLLATLPDEESASEVSDLAKEQFEAELAKALKRTVTLAFFDKEENERREQRSLIDWCAFFAKTGAWKSIRSYSIWTRLDEQVHQVRVALRVDLFPVVGLGGPIAAMTQRKFSGLCELYSCGRSIRVAGGEQRAVELAPSFILDLQATPVWDGSDGQNGQDGRTDAEKLTRAHARDAASLRPGEGQNA